MQTDKHTQTRKYKKRHARLPQLPVGYRGGGRRQAGNPPPAEVLSHRKTAWLTTQSAPGICSALFLHFLGCRLACRRWRTIVAETFRDCRRRAGWRLIWSRRSPSRWRCSNLTTMHSAVWFVEIFAPVPHSEVKVWCLSWFQLLRFLRRAMVTSAFSVRFHENRPASVGDWESHLLSVVPTIYCVVSLMTEFHVRSSIIRDLALNVALSSTCRPAQSGQHLML